MVTSDAKHRAGDTEAFFTLEPGLIKLGGRWTIESSVIRAIFWRTPTAIFRAPPATLRTAARICG